VRVYQFRHTGIEIHLYRRLTLTAKENQKSRNDGRQSARRACIDLQDQPIAADN
jgi:hypothetical protein